MAQKEGLRVGDSSTKPIRRAKRTTRERASILKTGGREISRESGVEWIWRNAVLVWVSLPNERAPNLP